MTRCAIARKVGISFSLEVTLNREHSITNVFAGELFASHSAGCRFVRETARTAVAAPYDVVVTTKFTRDVAPIRQTCSVDLGKRSRGDWLGIDSTEDLVSP